MIWNRHRIMTNYKNQRMVQVWYYYKLIQNKYEVTHKHKKKKKVLKMSINYLISILIILIWKYRIIKKMQLNIFKNTMQYIILYLERNAITIIILNFLFELSPFMTLWLCHIFDNIVISSPRHLSSHDIEGVES